MRLWTAVFVGCSLVLLASGLFAEDSPLEREWKAFEKTLKSLEKKSGQKEIDQELKLARKSMEEARKIARKAGAHAVIPQLKTVQRFLRNINIRALSEQEEFQRSAQGVLVTINSILKSLDVYGNSFISRNGLRTVLLLFPEGFVQMNWPESAVTGKAVTGTVRLRVRNADSPSQLKTIQQDYKLEIQGIPSEWSENYVYWKAKEAPDSVVIRVTDMFGNTLTEESLKSFATTEDPQDVEQSDGRDPAPGELTQEAQPLEPVPNVQIPHMLFSLPPVGQTGSVLSIRGDFDGDVDTTVIRLERRPVFLLAESTKETFLSLPEEISNPAEIYIREMDLRTRCLLFPIQVIVLPETGQLEPGQPLPVTIQINGVSRLRKSVVLNLEGLPRDSFSIDGGAANWSIQPAESNSLNYSRTLNALQATSFRLEAWIDTQSVSEMCLPPPD